MNDLLVIWLSLSLSGTLVFFGTPCTKPHFEQVWKDLEILSVAACRITLNNPFQSGD